jgi:hypothetical protein
MPGADARDERVGAEDRQLPARRFVRGGRLLRPRRGRTGVPQQPGASQVAPVGRGPPRRVRGRGGIRSRSRGVVSAQLSLAAADVYEASVVKLDSAGEFTDRWNPDEPTQFFWLDDAFGTTQLEVHLAREWTRVVPRIQAAVSAGTRVVVTSRDYIFQAARPHLKPALSRCFTKAGSWSMCTT